MRVRKAGDDKQHRDVTFRGTPRREQTPAESALWTLLRGRALAGAKFRRQVPVNGWVADFACLSHRLIIELDGAVHDEPDQAARDLSRDASLREIGWTILRFRNGDLREDSDRVVGSIRQALEALTPAAPQRPLSRRAGEG